MHEPRKLTDTDIRKLKFGGKPYLARDTHTAGLMERLNPRSRTQKGEALPSNVGSTDELSPDEAYLRAQEVITLVKRGIDSHEIDQSIPAPKRLAKSHLAHKSEVIGL